MFNILFCEQACLVSENFEEFFFSRHLLSPSPSVRLKTTLVGPPPSIIILVRPAIVYLLSPSKLTCRCFKEKDLWRCNVYSIVVL